MKRTLNYIVSILVIISIISGLAAAINVNREARIFNPSKSLIDKGKSERCCRNIQRKPVSLPDINRNKPVITAVLNNCSPGLGYQRGIDELLVKFDNTENKLNYCLCFLSPKNPQGFL